MSAVSMSVTPFAKIIMQTQSLAAAITKVADACTSTLIERRLAVEKLSKKVDELYALLEPHLSAKNAEVSAVQDQISSLYSRLSLLIKPSADADSLGAAGGAGGAMPRSAFHEVSPSARASGMLQRRVVVASSNPGEETVAPTSRFITPLPSGRSKSSSFNLSIALHSVPTAGGFAGEEFDSECFLALEPVNKKRSHTAMMDSAFALPDIEEPELVKDKKLRRSTADAAFTGEPSAAAETPRPFWGIRAIEGTPILSYARHEIELYDEAITSEIVGEVASKSVEERRRLKACLHSVLHACPSIGSIHTLAITAQALRVFVGVEPRIWSHETMAAVFASLEDVTIEEIHFAPHPKEEDPELFKRIGSFVERISNADIAKVKNQLRSLLFAAPALIPSHLETLASQAYHTPLPGILSPIKWKRAEPLTLQIERLLSYLDQAEAKQSAATDALLGRVEALDISKKKQLKAMLHTVLFILHIPSKEKLELGLLLVSRLLGDRTPHREETILKILDQLHSVPLASRSVGVGDEDAWLEFKRDAEAKLEGVSKEALQQVGNKLQGLLAICHLVPPSFIFLQAKHVLAEFAIADMSWEELDPAIQIARVCHIVLHKIGMTHT